MPVWSEDEVVDFYVTEAIILREKQQAKKEQKEAERTNWRKGHRQMGKVPRPSRRR